MIGVERFLAKKTTKRAPPDLGAQLRNSPEFLKNLLGAVYHMVRKETSLQERNTAIPSEIKNDCQWALWDRADKNKQPLKLDGSVMYWKKYPETKLSFEEVANHPNIETFITLESGILGIDIDGCIDENGEIHPIVRSWLGRTYAEKSPSGTGVKIWVRGKMPNNKSFENTEVP